MCSFLELSKQIIGFISFELYPELYIYLVFAFKLQRLRSAVSQKISKA